MANTHRVGGDPKEVDLFIQNYMFLIGTITFLNMKVMIVECQTTYGVFLQS